MTATIDWVEGGPLTTLFTPAASCSTSFSYDATFAPHVVWPDEKPNCHPTVRGWNGLYGVYFSPGLCPSGWYSAYDYSAKWHGAPTLVPGESVAICCPNGYTPYFMAIPPPRLSQGTCLSVLKSNIMVATCFTCTSLSALDSTDRDGVPFTAMHQTLMVRWQSSDLPVLAAAASGVTIVRPPSTSSLTGSLTSSPGTSKQVGPTQSGDNGTGNGDAGGPGSASPPSPGLSTGAQVGIGLGVALGAILVILVAVLLLKRRREQAKQIPPPRGGAKELAENPLLKAELPGEAFPPDVNELQANIVSDAKELPENPPAKPELPSDAVLVKLSELQAGDIRPPPAEFDASPPMPAELDSTTREPPSHPAGNVAVEVPANPTPLTSLDNTPPMVGPSSNTPATAATLATAASDSARDDDEEESRLMEEGRRLGDRRATLQETLRLLEEDERLREQQEAVRRRLEELRKGS